MALSLSITRAKTSPFDIVVYQADGVTPMNISGMTLYFHAVVGGVSIDKSSPLNGIVITDAAAGQALLTLDQQDTQAISQTGVYGGQCELTLEAGSADYEIARGTIVVLPNVGLP